jgi:predicted membrane channel-forming protein YqfA (hemolysin III family)
MGVFLLVQWWLGVLGIGNLVVTVMSFEVVRAVLFIAAAPPSIPS